MGRAETPVDPDGGPLQRFAHDLQVLRRKAGEPTYRTMARRAGLSATVLSQAAKGDRLPTLQTTLAFIRACGGDAIAERRWQERWERVREELHRRPAPAVAPDVEGGSVDDTAGPAAAAPVVPAVPVAPGDTADSAADSAAGSAAAASPAAESPAPGSHAAAGADVDADTAGAAVSARPSRRGLWLSWPRIAGIVCLSAALGAAPGLVFGPKSKSTSGRTPTATPASPPGHIADGMDPYLNGCRGDQQPLERQPIYRASGAFYGWVILFYSKTCAGAWGYVVGPNSPRWRVHVSAHRMDDNLEAPSSFQGSARPNSWGNAMSTLHGCVRAEAWIDTGPRAVTSCFNQLGPVRNAGGPVVVSHRGRK